MYFVTKKWRKRNFFLFSCVHMYVCIHNVYKIKYKSSQGNGQHISGSSINHVMDLKTNILVQTVFLEKIVSWMVNKSPPFMHSKINKSWPLELILSQWIQFTPSHSLIPIFLILPAKWSLTLMFFNKYFGYIPHCSAHLNLLALITLAITGDGWSISLCNFAHPPATSSSLGPNSLLGTLFSRHSRSMFFPLSERQSLTPV